MMNLDEAQKTARKLVEKMRPFCLTCNVAGSIRRWKYEVKDIEVVAVPRWEEDVDNSGLFPEPVTVNRLFQWAQGSDIRWIKPGVSEIVPWPIKPEGKYWRGLLPGGIKLDLFIAAPDNFGMIYAIRTGSAEFTTALVTRAKEIGMPCVDGYLTRDGRRVPTPDEATVFKLLGLEYVQPQNRTGYHSLRVAR